MPLNTWLDSHWLSRRYWKRGTRTTNAKNIGTNRLALSKARNKDLGMEAKPSADVVTVYSLHQTSEEGSTLQSILRGSLESEKEYESRSFAGFGGKYVRLSSISAYWTPHLSSVELWVLVIPCLSLFFLCNCHVRHFASVQHPVDIITKEHRPTSSTYTNMKRSVVLLSLFIAILQAVCVSNGNNITYSTRLKRKESKPLTISSFFITAQTSD